MAARQQNLLFLHHYQFLMRSYIAPENFVLSSKKVQKINCLEKNYIYQHLANYENNKNEDIDYAVFSVGNLNKDIMFVRNKGLMVDDDNKPSPKNIQMKQISFAELFEDQS